MNKKHFILILTPFLTVFNACNASILAKDSFNKMNFGGITVQLYPAGIITTFNFEKFISNRSSVLLRLGGNFANRKDYSPYNDNEKGNGYGGSLGYRHYFKLNKGSLFAGIHSDIWNMWIHWKNDISSPNYTHGTTYTLVLQPWIEAGYYFSFKNSKIRPGVSTSFGREINTITNGKGVGQGWMNSLLFHIQFPILNK